MSKDSIALFTELLDKGRMQDDPFGVIAEFLERDGQPRKGFASGVAWAFLLAGALAALKLAGIIGIGWLWVFLPVIGQAALIALFGLLLMNLRSLVNRARQQATPDTEG